MAVVDDAQDTTYTSTETLSQKVSATDKNVTYDFDRDGNPDQVHLGRVEEDAESGEETFNTQVTIEEDNVVQGVYLSSLRHTPPALPDITRQLDDSLSLEHEGLLQTITEKDLKNTDVYLFRVSTGELIAERTGATLSASDHSYQGTGVSDGTFHYTLHIRGKQQGKHKRMGFSSSRTDAEYQQVSRDEAFAAWQAESGVSPALHEREL